MNQVKSHIITDNSLTVVFDDGVLPLASSHRHFNQVRSALLDEDHDTVRRLLDVATRIKESSAGRFQVVNDIVVIDDEQLPETLARRLIQFVDSDLDTTPMVAFWENLRKNRSVESKKDLFNFLDHLGIVITVDGCFIAYKRVDNNFRDFQTGTLDHTPPREVSMPWDDVNPDRNVTCAAGLHAATYDYANTMYQNGILIEVKINPRDVVAVPIDYDGQKMRVCKLLSLRVCAGMREEPLYVGDIQYDEESDDNEDEFEDEDEDENEDDDDDNDNDDDDDNDDEGSFDDEEDGDKNDDEQLISDTDFDSVLVSADCRINIPASLVKQIWPNVDVNPPSPACNPRVEVTVYEEKILIGETAIGENGDFDLYEAFIDRHFNIRVPKSAVVAAGLDKYSTVKIVAILGGEKADATDQYIRVFV